MLNQRSHSPPRKAKGWRVGRGIGLLGGALILLLAPGTASAGFLYGFNNITNNSNVDVAGQFQVTVDTAGTNPTTGANRVSFQFENFGPLGSSIHEIFFDDGTLLGIASVQNGPGVNLTQLTNVAPDNLPGGNNLTPPFQVTAGFAVDVVKNAHDGINPGEHSTIIFDLQSGGTINDVIAELGDGRLRIGLHVGGIEGAGGSDSDSFVHNPPTVVPAPPGAILMGIGLVLTGSAGAWRRFRRRAAR